jgi:hypothetical protein
VLKVRQAQLGASRSPISEDSSLEKEDNSLPFFFRRCLEHVQEPIEHAVLAYLIHVAKPVNPREVARVVGLPTIKPVADTLCYLGLISRWVRDKEATLTASCGLFNDWYIRTAAPSASAD